MDLKCKLTISWASSNILSNLMIKKYLQYNVLRNRVRIHYIGGTVDFIIFFSIDNLSGIKWEFDLAVINLPGTIRKKSAECVLPYIKVEWNKHIQLWISLTKFKFRSMIFTKDNFRRFLWKIRR